MHNLQCWTDLKKENSDCIFNILGESGAGALEGACYWLPTATGGLHWSCWEWQRYLEGHDQEERPSEPEQ